MPADKPSGSGPSTAPVQIRPRRRPGRVPASCSECRRLKLRCNRQIPCDTCIRRACTALCPTGTMQTGRGRMTVAHEMQDKIDRLTARVLELEDTLRHTTHATTSQNSHSSPTTGSSPGASSLHRSNTDEGFLNAFGTLSLGSNGDVIYFGNTTRSEYLVHAARRSSQYSQQFIPHLSQEIVDASLHFDFGLLSEVGADMRLKLGGLLPPLSDARRLCEIYLEHGKYLWDGIPHDELFNQVIPNAYDNQSGPDAIESSHALSLLFTVFALATLFDITNPTSEIEAERYYVLSRAALRLAPPIIHTTLWSVHSLLQMSCYLEYGDFDFSQKRANEAWIHVGLAVRLCHSMGLHVNTSHWSFNHQTNWKRSRLFWQVFVKDTWMSFSFGRPPSTYPAYIDCELSGEPIEEYHPWMIRYTMLLHDVMNTAFSAARPTYQAILQLDRRIRDFPVISKMKISCVQGEETQPTKEVRLYRWLGMSAKESILVHLHRPYVVQALADKPANLLNHKFAPSVVALYRSAWRLIEGVLEAFRQIPQIMVRIRSCWSHMLAAAVVMCLIVTHAPSSNLARSALGELDKLCIALQGPAATYKILAASMDILNRLRNQGHDAINKSNPYSPALEEFDRLCGRSRVVVTESSQQFPQDFLPLSVDSRRPSPAPSDNTVDVWSCENLHPAILDYRKALEESVGRSAIPHPTLVDDSCYSSSTHSPDTNASELPLFVFTPQMRFSDNPYQYGQGLVVHTMHENAHLNENVVSAQPLTLDPGWYDFAEQLGFYFQDGKLI